VDGRAPAAGAAGSAIGGSGCRDYRIETPPQPWENCGGVDPTLDRKSRDGHHHSMEVDSWQHLMTLSC